MGDTARFIREKIIYWNPVLSRGLLWVGIAVLTDFRHSIGEFTKRIASGAVITGLEWSDALIGATLAGFIGARLFLDQTYSRHVDETKRKQQQEENMVPGDPNLR